MVATKDKPDVEPVRGNCTVGRDVVEADEATRGALEAFRPSLSVAFLVTGSTGRAEAVECEELILWGEGRKERDAGEGAIPNLDIPPNPPNRRGV